MKARVLLVASEAVPLAKTGGLADVITSLARALRERGVDATVMIPGYPSAIEQACGLKEIGALPALPGGAGRLLHGTMSDCGVPVVLLQTAAFDRRAANPYVDHEGNEYPDNALCFGALAHAAVAICAGETALPAPHVVHANDWHAGLIPTLLKLRGIEGVGTLLTIHNLAFQGNFPMETAAALQIPPELLTPEGLEFWGKLSFLKAGLLHADRISTVSRTYANEILTPRFGHGMEGLLNAARERLLAIRNGVDLTAWDAESDTLIARPFSFADMRGKSSCKRDLQTLFQLPIDPFAPILAIGSRITHQKMADVAVASLPQVLRAHPRAQVVVLGRGDKAYEAGFRLLASQFPDRVAVHIGYDERRAHALHAGADMLLHGSRFEPFGLTPLYSMRYGTVPIASRVGGMADTIADAGLHGTPDAGANGILFDGDACEDMTRAVSRAFELYAQPVVWHALQRQAMAADFSWAEPAQQYIDAYRDIAADAAKPCFVEPVAEPVAEVAASEAATACDEPLQYMTA
ncbi:glycogen synthase GlgA [Oxalobacteraceae bacterium OM1]|nr:glycogen synthase GlgA [Oxalobacteraceae bacterium OM1]